MTTSAGTPFDSSCLDQWRRWFISIKAIIVARPAIPYAARRGQVDLGSDDIPL
ncbi:MAG TPA: hypothetical protein VKF14_01750 [Candidatus Dormibacteraeota bacterium]|nr:hypothetical protein [Candidatus Dormibacteraeota bacterium]